MKARCSFWLILWVHTLTSLHKEYKHEHFTTKDNTNLFYKQVLKKEILLIGVHKLLKIWNKIRVWIFNPFSPSHVQSSSTTFRLFWRTVIIDPRQIRKCCNLSSHLVLGSSFFSRQRREGKKERKKEIWAWWNQMAHKVRAVRHTAF